MTPQEFINKTLGQWHDMDGAYGAQCWDYFAYMQQLAGYPITNCTNSGYVKDIWNDRNKNGVLKNFTEVSKESLKAGDWIIWTTSPYGTGNSHIAMFVSYAGVKDKVKVIGQNQDSSQKACYATLKMAGIGGCLRPNCWKTTDKPTAAKTYKVVKSIKGYRSSSDAKSKKNAVNTIKEGEYKIYSSANGMINVTKDKEAGTWINPSDNVAAMTTPTFKKNQKVKIKSSAKTYATGEKIPSAYKNKNYTILQIEKDKVLLKELYSWVKPSDIQ